MINILGGYDMAGSNWDTLAIDLNGNPTDGFFVSPSTMIRVEIYKNWLYICDSHGWRPGGFSRDVVAQIYAGNMMYYDVNIRAVRGPQDGVYVACWTVDGSIRGPKYDGIIGCGVYGFLDDKWVGVSRESIQFLQDWVKNGKSDLDDAIVKVDFSSVLRSC